MWTVVTIIRVSQQPEIQRQVRQQRANIDSLYELVEQVDQKVDALSHSWARWGHLTPPHLDKRGRENLTHARTQRPAPPDQGSSAES
jgi:hypothetical protein